MEILRYMCNVTIQGKTSRTASIIYYAGRPIGYSFEVSVLRKGDTVFDDGTIGTHSQPYTVKLLTIPGTPTADFEFQRSRPIRITGPLALNKDMGVVIEAAEAEYLNVTEED